MVIGSNEPGKTAHSWLLSIGSSVAARKVSVVSPKRRSRHMRNPSGTGTGVRQ